MCNYHFEDARRIRESDPCGVLYEKITPDLKSYNFNNLNRRALPITLTEDNDIAAAAIMGESRIPKSGYSMPAAMGTPAVL